LSGSGPLTINVNWVPRPPFFNPNRTASSARFTISMNEHAGAGTILSQPLSASSKDPWTVPTLRYAWLSPGALASYFRVNDTTAVVSCAPTIPNVQYNDVKSFTLTLRVVDSMALEDTATVVINVVDVNDPAVFNGTFSAAMQLVPGALQLSESAQPGSLVGYVKAWDQDRDPVWGAVNYRFTDSVDASKFVIHSATGAITVAPYVAFDFWDQTSYTMEVQVYDNDPLTPIVVTRMVTVQLTQVNTVSIEWLYAGSEATPTQAVNVTDSVGGKPADNVTTLASTVGGSRVLIAGRGFGRTARRLAVEGGSTTVQATFGVYGTEYTAKSCSVVQPNTLIACTMPAGIGRGHKWRIVVDGWAATSESVRSGYFAPSISSVVKDTQGGTLPPDTLTTSGTDFVLVSGQNFGDDRQVAVIILQYGPRSAGMPYFSPSCAWVANQTQLRCGVVPGVGTDFGWVLTIGGQPSAQFTASSVRYAT
ncbi:cadherin repeat domain-containing protein, partial [archaeon]